MSTETSTPDAAPPAPESSSYLAVERTSEFASLRSALRRFVFPTTVAFLAWYLLYVVMSMWAHDFMSKEVWGNINVALVFGLLQFLTTFLIAWLYARYMGRNVDPLARDLEKRNNDRQGGGVR